MDSFVASRGRKGERVERNYRRQKYRVCDERKREEERRRKRKKGERKEKSSHVMSTLSSNRIGIRRLKKSTLPTLPSYLSPEITNAEKDYFSHTPGDQTSSSETIIGE